MNTNIYNPYVRRELELYHHGIMGQRWGKKNGPPYPLSAGAHSASEKKAGWRQSLAGTQTRGGARKYTKELNKADKKLATARYDRFKESEKVKRYQDKANKLAASGKSAKKIEKYKSKAEKHMLKAQEYGKEIQNASNRTDTLIKYLSAQGYSMSSRKVNRHVHIGRNIATSALTNLGSVALATLVGSPMYVTGHRISKIQGTKYKVKKTKYDKKQFVQTDNDNKNYEYSATNSNRYFIDSDGIRRRK